MMMHRSGRVDMHDILTGPDERFDKACFTDA